jgi:hypothetical protein
MEVLQSLATSKITGLPRTMEHWISILDFSKTISNLPIPEIREAAVKAISNLVVAPLDKVLLARKYAVKQLLIEGYVGLVEQRRSISVDEEAHLGAEAMDKLLRMRDRSNWTVRIKKKGSSRLTHYLKDLREDVCSRFAEEMEDIEDMSNRLSPEEPQNVLSTDYPESATRDEMFYFETETIHVSIFNAFPEGDIS